MEKTTKTPAIKQRETKLMKKSSEELINIILKKDKVEKNLNSQIVNLKGEVNSLNTRIKGFNKDFEGTEKELKNLKDYQRTLRETIDSLRIQIKEKEEVMESDKKYIVELEEKYTEMKNVSIVLLFATIAATVLGIFVF